MTQNNVSGIYNDAQNPGALGAKTLLASSPACHVSRNNVSGETYNDKEGSATCTAKNRALMYNY